MTVLDAPDGNGTVAKRSVTTTPVQSLLLANSPWPLKLAEHMAEVPVLVIGALKASADLPARNQAGLWGSLLPAAWSLQLALRARGLGSAWTTLHLQYEAEIAALLGIPDDVRQGVLLPVAYTRGTDFRPAPRQPLDTVLHVDTW